MDESRRERKREYGCGSPKRVIVCGSRNSGDAFLPAISAELGKLPPGSLVMHGGRPGVEAQAGQIATGLGLQVEDWQLTWERREPYSKDATQISIWEMMSTRPDFALGFHPNVPCGAETGEVLALAVISKVPVRLYDLKRWSTCDADDDSLDSL